MPGTPRLHAHSARCRDGWQHADKGGTRPHKQRPRPRSRVSHFTEAHPLTAPHRRRVSIQASMRCSRCCLHVFSFRPAHDSGLHRRTHMHSRVLVCEPPSLICSPLPARSSGPRNPLLFSVACALGASPPLWKRAGCLAQYQQKATGTLRALS